MITKANKRVIYNWLRKKIENNLDKKTLIINVSFQEVCHEFREFLHKTRDLDCFIQTCTMCTQGFGGFDGNYFSIFSHIDYVLGDDLKIKSFNFFLNKDFYERFLAYKQERKDYEENKKNFGDFEK